MSETQRKVSEIKNRSGGDNLKRCSWGSTKNEKAKIMERGKAVGDAQKGELKMLVRK